MLDDDAVDPEAPTAAVEVTEPTELSGLAIAVEDSIGLS